MVKSSSHLAGGSRHIKMSKTQRNFNRLTNKRNKAITSGKMVGTYSSRTTKSNLGKTRLMKIGRKTKRSRN